MRSLSWKPQLSDGIENSSAHSSSSVCVVIFHDVQVD